MKELPRNIKRDDILQGIRKIEEEGIPPQAHSSTYDLLYNGKRFPPKLVLAYANIFANGEELDRNEFEGGKGTTCFKILKDNGFKIVLKNESNSISETLVKFLEQAKGNSLKTKDYIRYFDDLQVKVSFGMASLARVPWISFLAQGQKTSNGIYPVYLFYKKYNILVLAYGVSEGTVPVVTWNLDTNVETINSYFKKRNIIPDRYGDSYVYAVYDTTKPLNYTLIEEDLKRIIAQYKSIITSDKDSLIALSGQSKKYDEKDFEPESFMNDLNSTGLVFSSEFVSRFILSLLTKPFVILSGLAGSGKTQLAMMFAKWICEDIDKQVCMIPVGADWTNREFLIGYPNALEKGAYVKPDNGALDLIIEANKNPRKPYFLILDEMNLSYVERYFSDFLSVMESEEGIPLMKNCIDKEITPVIKLPRNLFIIGTINVDETTYMFSPKVLDRANVLEFRIMEKDMKDFLQKLQPIHKDIINNKGVEQATSFVKLAVDSWGLQISEERKASIITSLECFFYELKKIHAEFGYRTACEIFRFMALAEKVNTKLEGDAIVDAAIIQKLLPKLHGSRKKVEPVLKALWNLCLVQGSELTLENTIEFVHNDQFKYPLSAEKIWRMYCVALDNGFTSFAEA